MADTNNTAARLLAQLPAQGVPALEARATVARMLQAARTA